MTRVFTEGAESGDLLFWTAPSSSASNVASSRIGGRCFQVPSQGCSKTITAVSEFYLRAAFNSTIDNQPWRVEWGSSGTILGSLRLNATSKKMDIYTSSGTLQVSGAGTQVLAATYYVIELHVKIADVSGVIEFKVDGVLQTGFSGDTKPGADTTANTLLMYGPSGGQLRVDDIAFNDTAGGVDDSWCGDGHVYGLAPNANGDSSQWVGSDGNSTDNYLLVDEIPSNSDTDYVSSATSTNKDFYNVASLPTLPAGSIVKRVIVEARAREETADGDSILLGVKSGTTESFNAGTVLGISYAPHVAVFTVNPDTSAVWSESEINSMQIGVKVP